MSLSMTEMFLLLVNHVSWVREMWKAFIKENIRLGRVPNSAPADITNPILPTSLVQWFNGPASTALRSLNPALDPTSVNAQCSGKFECIHDFIIRLNRVSSSATAQSLDSFRNDRTILGKHRSARRFFHKLIDLFSRLFSGNTTDDQLHITDSDCIA